MKRFASDFGTSVSIDEPENKVELIQFALPIRKDNHPKFFDSLNPEGEMDNYDENQACFIGLDIKETQFGPYTLTRFLDSETELVFGSCQLHDGANFAYLSGQLTGSHWLRDKDQWTILDHGPRRSELDTCHPAYRKMYKMPPSRDLIIPANMVWNHLSGTLYAFIAASAWLNAFPESGEVIKVLEMVAIGCTNTSILFGLESSPYDHFSAFYFHEKRSEGVHPLMCPVYGPYLPGKIWKNPMTSTFQRGTKILPKPTYLENLCRLSLTNELTLLDVRGREIPAIDFLSWNVSSTQSSRIIMRLPDKCYPLNLFLIPIPGVSGRFLRSSQCCFLSEVWEVLEFEPATQSHRETPSFLPGWLREKLALDADPFMSQYFPRWLVHRENWTNYGAAHTAIFGPYVIGEVHDHQIKEIGKGYYRMRKGVAPVCFQGRNPLYHGNQTIGMTLNWSERDWRRIPSRSLGDWLRTVPAAREVLLLSPPGIWPAKAFVPGCSRPGSNYPRPRDFASVEKKLGSEEVSPLGESWFQEMIPEGSPQENPSPFYGPYVPCTLWSDQVDLWPDKVWRIRDGVRMDFDAKGQPTLPWSF